MTQRRVRASRECPCRCVIPAKAGIAVKYSKTRRKAGFSLSGSAPRASFRRRPMAVRNNPEMPLENEWPRCLHEMQRGGDFISGSDHLSGASSRRRPEALFNRRRSGHPVATTLAQALRLLDSGLRPLLSGIIQGCLCRANAYAVYMRCSEQVTSFLAATTYPARHPGAGRDPITAEHERALPLLDSGLRRNDEQMRKAGRCRTGCGCSTLSRTAVGLRRNDAPERRVGTCCAQPRVFKIIPDSNGRRPE